MIINNLKTKNKTVMNAKLQIEMKALQTEKLIDDLKKQFKVNSLEELKKKIEAIDTKSGRKELTEVRL